VSDLIYHLRASFYESWLYDLWLDLPKIGAYEWPGLITAFAIIVSASWLALRLMKTSSANIFWKAFLVALVCFLVLLFVAMIGLLVWESIGPGGRSGLAFLSGYIAGSFYGTVLIFFASLGRLALTLHSRGTR